MAATDSLQQPPITTDMSDQYLRDLTTWDANPVTRDIVLQRWIKQTCVAAGISIMSLDQYLRDLNPGDSNPIVRDMVLQRWMTLLANNIGGGGVPTQPATIGSTINNSGNSTITALSAVHIEVVTIGGVARTSHFILDTMGRNTGDRLTILFANPATVGIEEILNNGTLGGTQLGDYTTDGSGTDPFRADFFFEVTWQRLGTTIPAYT